MQLRDMMIVAMACTSVATAVVAMPLLLKSPAPLQPIVLKADKEAVVQPQLAENVIDSRFIRTIPLTKQSRPALAAIPPDPPAPTPSPPELDPPPKPLV